MAIEHRAIFALSIAFTASLVVFPDLPADIPPRAGFDGPFVGAPFVALFLPIAAVVMWWIVDNVSEHSRQTSARDTSGAGAATALFLSAFHVTMLIAFIGGQPWLGRILGAMVGAFLVATGNDLPRVRPNLTWGIRTHRTLRDAALWRRVHRLTGFLRVATGLAICVAALAGRPWLTQLIVAAVAFETVTGVAASMLLSRRRHAAAAIAIAALGTAATAHAQDIPSDRIASLPAMIDAAMPKLLDEQHIVGAAVAVVYDGRIVMTRGYGRARLDPDVAVDPERTLFRIGSVTKAFTGLAALQLVDAGTLDLHQDIRAYVTDVPMRYGATTHQLLTHTAGFGERFAGAYTDAEHLVPLAQHLRRSPPPQDVRPGRVYSYSNYNAALAGRVIEMRSGMTFERYLDAQVFEPLQMRHSTARQPPPTDLSAQQARGYRWNGRSHDPLDYRYVYATPSGGVSTTAADMGRFMLALLSGGSLDGRRVLSPESTRAMGASSYSPDPRIQGVGYAFVQLAWRGHDFLYRDGTLGDQAASLFLLPQQRLGIFVASNALPGAGDFLYVPMMTHLFGDASTPLPSLTPRPGAGERGARLAGAYRDYHHTRHDMSRLRALMPMIQSRVGVADDGALLWQGSRWLEVEPRVYRREDALDVIVFREGGPGEALELHAAGSAYERIDWLEQTAFHGVLLVACLLAFLSYTIAGLVSWLRKRPAPAEGHGARRVAALVATLNLGFLVALLPSLRELGAVTPLPWTQVLLLSLPLASVAATALLPGFAALAWISGWWTRRERLGYSTFAVLSVAFMVFLNYWKLLGMRY